jgi:hypothetical protein
MSSDLIARGMAKQNSTLLTDLSTLYTVNHSANTFTLDLQNKANKNFKITSVADIAQVETATVVGTISANPSGDATVTVTSTGMVGSPLAITVPLLLGDNASAIATKIRDALTANATINAKFIVGGLTDKVILTARTPAANDIALNIAIATGTATGLTAAPTSADTTAGGSVAKTLAFSNVDSNAGFLQTSILFVCTVAAAFTHPTGAVFAAGAPTFVDGQSYWLTYDSIDGGTSWAGLCVRRT